MGMIFSKNNKIKHFASPKKFYDEISGISSDDDNFLENIDPRSPCSTITRTPVQINHGRVESVAMESYDTPVKRSNPNLKDKLLKKLGYNLKDPRSPSHVISRTPIILNDKEHPVADSSMVPSVEFKEISNTISFKSELLSVCHELSNSLTEFHSERIQETDLDSTPMQDPRSPSIGIERTPLCFDHIETRSPNDSNDSNVDEEINKMVNELISDIKVYTRKSIEAKELSFAAGNSTPKVEEDLLQSKKFVYEEIDDIKYSISKVSNTPKSSNNEGTSNRTPLQCLGNKTQSKISARIKNTTSLRKHIKLTKKNFIYNDENDTPEEHIKSVSKLTNKSKYPVLSYRVED